MSIAYAVNQLFNIIFLLLLVKILLSWVPSINWHKEPFYSLKRFSDIFFEPFRRVIPPVGMLDLSPIVAFIVFQIIQHVVVNLLVTFGL